MEYTGFHQRGCEGYYILLIGGGRGRGDVGHLRLHLRRRNVGQLRFLIMRGFGGHFRLPLEMAERTGGKI